VKYWFYILFFCTLSGNYSGFGQEELNLKAADTVETKINPLAPSKAAFFSAVFPGMGQVYNKKYWKAPIVWGAMGTGIYAYSWNKKKYDSYRTEYKKRLANDSNLNPDYERLSNTQLIDAQKFHQRNKDLSLLVTVAIYALNIIDANVDSHLKQFNVNGKLTVKPEIQQNEFTYKQNVGLSLNYRF
jgi:hypothetical protein